MARGKKSMYQAYKKLRTEVRRGRIKPSDRIEAAGKHAEPGGRNPFNGLRLSEEDRRRLAGIGRRV